MKRFIILLALACAVSCDVYFHLDPSRHYHLSGINTSARNVYFSVGSQDTSPIHCPFDCPEEFCIVESGKSNEYLCPSGGWSYEGLIQSCGGALVVYVFPSYTHDPVVLNDFKLVCYTLSLDDFIALDYRLSFPPDERMKDMAMDPPYESFL